MTLKREIKEEQKSHGKEMIAGVEKGDPFTREGLAVAAEGEGAWE